MTSTLVAAIAAFTFALPSVAQSQAATRPAPKPLLGGNPRVSRDGSQILYTVNHDGKSQLFVMNADGSDVRQLTTELEGAHSANWSPDGRRVVYVTPGAPDYRIVVIGANGSARQILTEAKGNQAPSWSPDGSKILFAAGEYPNINIHTMNADGTDRRNIAPNPGFDYDPMWSPDGKTIAFVSGIRGKGPKVHLMNADGSGRRQLAETEYSEERPAWSPDGRQIAFQASTRGANGAEAFVYVADATTGVTRLITRHDRPRLDETPSWFADGKRLAIQSDRDGTWSVYVIDLDGTTLARLTPPR